MVDQNQSSIEASGTLDFSESDPSLFGGSQRSYVGTIDLGAIASEDNVPPSTTPQPTGLYRQNPSSFSSSEAPDDSERSLPPLNEDEECVDTNKNTCGTADSPARQNQNKCRLSFAPTRNLVTDSIQYGSTANLLSLFREASNRSLVKESSDSDSDSDSDRSLKMPRLDEEPVAIATACDNEDHDDRSTISLVGNGTSSTQANSQALVKYDDPEPEDSDNADRPSLAKKSSSFKKIQGVLKNKSKAGPVRKKRLSRVSSQYDLDGDGVLDPIEQAMRDRDIDGDGQLDNAEIYQIVQDQLKAQKDVHLYKKVSAGLVCLVFILALSNFGTSWATAIMSKETVADADTSTIQSKSSHEVIGINQVAHEIDLEPLTDEEFEERRLLVDAEMEEDPNHEDHFHRRLGRKDDNHVCTCTKIAYDHGKLKERDLMELIRKCDGSNTVSIKRKWKGSDTYDVDTICGPGTDVVKKGKKKNNKNKTKTKFVEEQVKFRRKGHSGKDGGKNQEISFDCKNGYCYGSGQTLLQQEGHPCNLDWDRDGAGECDDGLVCYDSDGTGTGMCTLLVRYARKNQVCDIDFGVDACESGYACYSATKKTSTLMGVVNTGTCQKLAVRVSNQDVCDASYGNDACDIGYTCIGENGRELNGYGIGYCQRLVQKQRSGGMCDLSLGWDACDDGYYCRDSMMTRSGGNGAGNAWTGAIISGPSGTVGGQMGVRGRTSGTGTCARTSGRGDRCESDEECGWNGTCVGLGADTATGGVIRGASGTIVWGTGGATTGICG